MQTEKQEKTDSHATSTSSRTNRKISEIKTTFKTELHREITPHIMTTMTSQRDRIVFTNILPASKGLKVIIWENQRN